MKRRAAKNMWATPALFVETEDTNWSQYGKGFSLSIIRNGVRVDGIEIGPQEFEKVCALLRKLGIEVREHKRGQPERPRWQR